MQVGWSRCPAAQRSAPGSNASSSSCSPALRSQPQQPPLIILLQLLQQLQGASSPPPTAATGILLLQLVLHSANCSQSRACPSESKLMQHTRRPILQQNKTQCQQHLMHIALSVNVCTRSLIGEILLLQKLAVL